MGVYWPGVIGDDELPVIRGVEGIVDEGGPCTVQASEGGRFLGLQQNQSAPAMIRRPITPRAVPNAIGRTCFFVDVEV